MQRIALAIALVASAASAQAVTLTQWNFNSSSLTPSIGAGSVSAVGNVSITGYNSGTGSSDPAAAGNVGLQTTRYAAQGTADQTAGVQFAVSTVGYDSITFGYDLRHSNTSAANEAVLVSTDNGATFQQVGSFAVTAGDAWANGRSVDLTSLAGAAQNPNLIFRVVAAQVGGAYIGSTAQTAAGYATTGTWRFDMVTVSGNAVAAVPEASTTLMTLAGLAAIGFVARRRRAA